MGNEEFLISHKKYMQTARRSFLTWSILVCEPCEPYKPCGSHPNNCSYSFLINWRNKCNSSGHSFSVISIEIDLRLLKWPKSIKLKILKYFIINTLHYAKRQIHKFGWTKTRNNKPSSILGPKNCHKLLEIGLMTSDCDRWNDVLNLLDIKIGSKNVYTANLFLFFFIILITFH